MVFADDEHRARLRSVISGFFRETQLRADFERVEVTVHQAVAVKKDVTTVRGLQPAEVEVRPKQGYPAVGGGFMVFDFAATHTDVVLKLAAYAVERITQGDVRIFMRVIGIGRTRDDDFLARDRNVDAKLIQITLVMVFVRRLENHPATDDFVVEFFELVHPLANCGFQGR